ncbi:MAG: 4Fe-4S dicluster domain-containing protein [Polyangiales bacterium]
MSRRDPYLFAESEQSPPLLWRSLDEKAEGPGPDAAAEFPTGVVAAQRLTEGRGRSFGRRPLLGVTGIAGLATSLAGCIRRPVEKILPYTDAPEDLVPGVPQHYATAAEMQGEAVGLVVESHEGRPTKIEGNPSHPASQGKASLWAQASVLDLYDPDRPRRASRLGDSGARETVGMREVRAELMRLRERHQADQGRGLRFLVRPSLSPTVHRLCRAVQAQFPRAKVYQYAPVNDDNARVGARMAFGEDANARIHYGRARVVLSLDADFLFAEPGAVSAARAFARGRRPQQARDEMNRLYVVESSFSLTGAQADHRLSLQPRQVGAYLVALVHALAAEGLRDLDTLRSTLPRPELPGVDAVWLQEVARDLMRHRGRAPVVVGRRQPAHVHALGHAVNKALGNFGSTVALSRPIDKDAVPCREDIKALAAELGRGAVQSLIILGGNPVYDAPSDLRFAEALRRDGLHVVHVASQGGESSALAHWHIPALHYLESWGDVQSLDGTQSIQQPLIRPLGEGLSEIDVWAAFAEAKPHSAYHQVRRTWRRKHGDALSFERIWRRALHSGVIDRADVSVLVMQLDSDSLQAGLRRAFKRGLGRPSASLQVNFIADSRLVDGQSGNNPWLLELPCPMSKLSWDNAALMSPADARRLQVQSGDVLRLASDEGKVIEIAAYVLPGQPKGTVSLPLGWGRQKAGRHGNGHGFDVYPLRTLANFDVLDGVRVHKAGRRHDLAQTQTHHSMEGRPIAIDATQAQYRKQPDFASWRSVELSTPPLWQEVDYSEGHRWSKVIDLSACTGCNACVVACQSENNLPVVGKDAIADGRDMYWIRIDRYFVGEDESDPQVSLQPVACQHCEEAPCENVCPVNATMHSPEGLNTMAYNRCIGTRYCMNNCPYKVRRFNYLSWHDNGPEGKVPERKKMQFNPNVTVRMRGVMEKCTYCVQRIQRAKIQQKVAGKALRDDDITPACAQTCPADAIVFGDLNDPGSRVSKASQVDRRYKLLAEIGAQPRTTFLAKIRNPNPAMHQGAVGGKAHAAQSAHKEVAG